LARRAQARYGQTRRFTQRGKAPVAEEDPTPSNTHLVGHGNDAPTSTQRSIGSTVGIVALSCAVQLLAWAALYLLFGVARVGYSFFALGDVAVTYHEYAVKMAHGLIPFRDFFIEYPPLFAPLLWAAGNPEPVREFVYRFALLMLGFMLAAGAITALSADDGEHRRRPAFAALLFAGFVLALGPIPLNRYDATVALVIALVLLLFPRGHYASAGVMVGLGVALKVTPLIFLPLLLILAPAQRRWGTLGGFAVAALTPFAAALALEGRSTTYLQWLLEYHLKRPLEVESVAATPLWIARLYGGPRIPVGFASGSQVILTQVADTIARFSVIALLILLLAVLVLVWRRRVEILGDPKLIALAMLATLLAALVGSKVLSPQYLVWVLPLAAVVAIDRKILGVLLGMAFLLTQIEFPANYWAFAMRQQPGPIAIVVARNIVLVAAFALSVWHLWRVPPSTRVL
jgi:uncharacterized membrane protein